MAELIDNKPTLRERVALRLLRSAENKRASIQSQLFDISSPSLLKLLKRFRKQLVNPYGQHPVVYSCIKLIADDTGQVPFKIVTEDKSAGGNRRLTRDDYIRARLGPDRLNPTYPDLLTRADSGFREVESKETALVDLFTKPNPVMTSAQFWNATVTYLSAQGEVDIWAKDRTEPTKIPDELWPMNPIYFTPLPRGIQYPAVPLGWEFRKGSAKKGMVPEELIRPRIMNMVDPLRGQSPMEVADTGLQMDWNARLYNIAFFENDATPGGFIIKEKHMDPKARKKWIEDWNVKHQGSMAAFQWALIDGATKVQPITFTPKDVHYEKLSSMTKEELAMIWRVPLVMLSHDESIPNAKDQAERRGFWTDTLIPIIRHLEDIFWAELFQHIEGGKYWGVFDLSGVEALQENFESKLDQADKLYKMTVPFNTINDRLNLGFENLPWGDIAIVPNSMVTIDSVVGGLTLPPQKAEARNADGSDGANRIVVEESHGVKIDDPSTVIKIGPEFFDTIKMRQSQKKSQQNFTTFKKPFEKEYVKKYRRYLFKYRKAILAAVDKAMRSPESDIADAILQSEKKWDNLLRKAMNPVYEETVEGSAIFTAAEVGSESFLTATSPELVKIASRRTVKIVGVNDTMRNNLRKEITLGLTEGETVGQIQTRIRSVMNFQDRRALTIARTEVGGSASEARDAEFKNDGVEKTIWMTAGLTATPRPRDSHLAAQGVGPLKRGKTFANTKCRFPLDPQGPADQVINCRCVAVPVI